MAEKTDRMRKQKQTNRELFMENIPFDVNR